MSIDRDFRQALENVCADPMRFRELCATAPDAVADILRGMLLERREKRTKTNWILGAGDLAMPPEARSLVPRVTVGGLIERRNRMENVELPSDD